jgi:hypothetical protein
MRVGTAKWLLAIVGQKRLDQSGALEPGRVRRPLVANAEIAEPVVTLPVERPIPRRL